jgi:recombination protein RecR
MKSLDRIISAFRKFPGTGPRQAERFAMYVIKASSLDIKELIDAIQSVKSTVKQCRICCNYSEEDICPICGDRSRDSSIICVVKQSQDICAIEKTRIFNGVYHVLHGCIDPLKGADHSSVKLKELIARVKNSNGSISEIIIATNPDAEGETTAMYLAKMLKSAVPKITRIAYGVPLGGNIDYMDEITLGHALKGRTKL